VSNVAHIYRCFEGRREIVVLCSRRRSKRPAAIPDENADEGARGQRPTGGSEASAAARRAWRRRRGQNTGGQRGTWRFTPAREIQNLIERLRVAPRLRHRLRVKRGECLRGVALVGWPTAEICAVGRQQCLKPGPIHFPSFHHALGAPSASPIKSWA